jgi:preprotein translocase subunit SecB
MRSTAAASGDEIRAQDNSQPHANRIRGMRQVTSKGTGSMAEGDNSNAGNMGGNLAGEAAPQTQVRVLGQYIKDLSFENPNVRKMLDNSNTQQQQPNLRVEVSVNISKMAEKVFESSIQFKAEATNDTGVIYDLELAYAGLFQVDNMPEQMLEPFLLVNCPSLLFPYLRRLAADLTREGGFPPLVLDPIDFGNLYMSRQREKAAQAAVKTN